MHVFMKLSLSCYGRLRCSDVAAGVEMLSGRYRGLLTPPVTGHWAQYLIIAGALGAAPVTDTGSSPAPRHVRPRARRRGCLVMPWSPQLSMHRHRSGRLTPYVLDIIDSTFCPILSRIFYILSIVMFIS